jgi:hypothetical protein
MAKKKEEVKEKEAGWTTVANQKELDAVQAKLKEIDQTLENFRTSFGNLDLKIKTLIERNRLR